MSEPIRPEPPPIHEPPGLPDERPPAREIEPAPTPQEYPFDPEPIEPAPNEVPEHEPTNFPYPAGLDEFWF
ncbi:hypothetical protein ACNOYE_10185 [Nannocystaceae bacterium ST9]